MIVCEVDRVMIRQLFVSFTSPLCLSGRVLVAHAVQEDDARAKNHPAFSGMAIAEKFHHMLRVLDTDKDYALGYARFIMIGVFSAAA
jgi:hypothetical protein